MLRLEIMRTVGINGTSHRATVSKNGRIIRDEKISTAVLNIEFSPRGSFLAISFDNKRLSLEEAQDNADKFGAVIAIYEVREHEVGTVAGGQEVTYQKRRELRLASLSAPEISKMSIFGNANYFMSFSEDELFLIVYYQNINNNLIRENKDREGRYMVWNHETAATEMNWGNPQKRQISKQKLSESLLRNPGVFGSSEHSGRLSPGKQLCFPRK